MKSLTKPVAAVLSSLLVITAPGPQAAQAASQVFKSGSKASALPVSSSFLNLKNRLPPDSLGFSNPNFLFPAALAPATVPAGPAQKAKQAPWQEMAAQWSEEIGEITKTNRPLLQYAGLSSLFDLSSKSRFSFAVPDEPGSQPGLPGPSRSSQSNAGGKSGETSYSRPLRESILESSWKALGILYTLDRKASKQQIHDEIQSLISKEQEKLEKALSEDPQANKAILSFLQELSSEIQRLNEDSPDAKEYRNALGNLTNRIKEWAILRADAPHPFRKAEQSDKVPAIQASGPAVSDASDYKNRLDSQRRQERIAEWAMRAVYAGLAVAGFYAPWSGQGMALYIFFGHIMAVLFIVQPLEIYLRTNYGQGLSLKTAHFLIQWPQLIFYLSALTTVPLHGTLELFGIPARPRFVFFSLLLAYNIFSAAWAYLRKSPFGMLRESQFKPYIIEFTPTLDKEIPELTALYLELLGKVSGYSGNSPDSEADPVWNMLTMDYFSRTIFNLYKKRVSIADLEGINIQYLPAGVWRKKVADRSAVESPSAAFRIRTAMKDGSEYSFILMIPREKDQTLEKKIFELQNAILEYGEEYSKRIPALGAYSPFGKMITLADTDWPFGDKLEPFFMKVALDAPESEGTPWERVKAHLQKSGAFYLKDRKWRQSAQEALEQLGLR